jgi:hypothetical protein
MVNENMQQAATTTNEPTSDQILSEINTTTTTEPSAETTPAPTQSAPTQTQQTPTAQQILEYQALGKTVKEPIDMVLKRASMGYDYAQKMEQFKKEQEAFQNERNRLAEQESKWKPIDEYARQNPEWEKHVRESWEKRDAIASGKYNDLDPVIAEKLARADKFINQYENDLQVKRKETEDAVLMNSIMEVQKQHPDIDFKASDDQGRTLEYRILEHANRNGINSFKAAFRDLMFEDIMSRKEVAAKEAVAKELAERTKTGLLGKTQAPILDKGPANVRSKSWEEIKNMAINEFTGKH